MPDNPSITYYGSVASKTDTEVGAQRELEYYHTLATLALRLQAQREPCPYYQTQSDRSHASPRPEDQRTPAALWSSSSTAVLHQPATCQILRDVSTTDEGTFSTTPPHTLACMIMHGSILLVSRPYYIAISSTPVTPYLPYTLYPI